MDWHGHTILAPLTKGGNLPFRRLCVELGARVTMSEMAYSRQVVRGSRAELALLRRHPSEACFGVQLAACKPDEAVAAGRRAVDAGAAFVDINAGCPIHDVVRRGMGATLLQRPAAWARLIEGLATGLSVPVTVKLRSGWNEEKINAPEVARLMEEAGAAAVTLHARTREQRYTKAADWGLIAQLAAERTIPVVGNGDILTYYDARERQRQSGCASVMLGRGALIKPWLFREIAEQRAIEPTAEERVAIYRRLAVLMKEHFRDDAKGRERAMRFLPWHLSFFWRYRPLPETEFGGAEHPLMQTRQRFDADIPMLEQVLRDPREQVHRLLADALWDAADDAAAVGAALEIAERNPVEGPEQQDEIETSFG
ncbi:MAG: tRNA-dihydrouridine synthase family protein [Planctomycetes bacterium]|nr:tRNA-dihydrouridine synthase family protein [Planctomycetota bacterium]